MMYSVRSVDKWHQIQERKLVMVHVHVQLTYQRVQGLEFVDGSIDEKFVVDNLVLLKVQVPFVSQYSVCKKSEILRWANRLLGSRDMDQEVLPNQV